MSKTVVRVRASKSTSETRLPAGKDSSADSLAIHPVRSTGSDENSSAPLADGGLFAALTQSLAPLLAETVHDLSNTLGSLHLFLDLLELESDNSEKVLRRLRQIHPVVTHAEDMTRQLLDPVKLGNAGKQEDIEMLAGRQARKISLNPVLQRMVPMLSAMLQPNIVLHLSLAPDLVPVVIDPTQVVRIVSNLVLNSRDAIPCAGMTPRGEVTIETANWQVAGTDNDIGWVLLRVRDTGTGMTDATRARIFQPFFTTKPPGEGSGLGLSSVLRIVQRAGGTIQVESVPEKGTDITILFPSAGLRNGAGSRNGKAPQHLQPSSSANRDVELPQSEIQRSSR